MKTVAIGLIQYDGKILIGKKIEKLGHSLSGKWHIPGGKVISGEMAEDAIVREMLEETNLEVEVISRMASNILTDKFMVWFLCKPKNGIDNMRAGGDLTDLKFVSKEEVLELLRDRAMKSWPRRIVKFMRG